MTLTVYHYVKPHVLKSAQLPNTLINVKSFCVFPDVSQLPSTTTSAATSLLKCLSGDADVVEILI